MLHAPPRVHLGRVLLTALAAVLFALGWAAGVVVAAVLWTVAAVRLGFADARGRR